MTGSAAKAATFSPSLAATEPLANYWLRQVMLRLRREVCWMWYERTGAEPTGITPPRIDSLSESLDRSRYWDDKQHFFFDDPTARYLTEEISSAPPLPEEAPIRGSFGWVVDQLALDPASIFLLSMGLTAAFDSAAGAVIAACHNDAARTTPTVALAQQLWHPPADILGLADSAGTLFRYGLLCRPGAACAGDDWLAPVYTPELVARRLLFPAAAPPPQLVAVRSARRAELSPSARLTALQARADPQNLRVIAVLVPSGGALGPVLESVADITGRGIVELRGGALSTAATLCWLDGTDLLVRSRCTPTDLAGAPDIPITIFADTDVPPQLWSASLEVAPMTYGERIAYWTEALGAAAADLGPVIAETSRRFRYEAETIDRIVAGIAAQPGQITPAALTATCRYAARLELGDMAQPVAPRFESTDDLFLAPKQSEQFAEVLRAMRNLTEVHYGWGTARVWNEGGISVLFAGPPGTGKTMASEILAAELDLPMYRIDLSQVVNKYIGETEKNLKRIFDAADVSDALLLFDEADAIFGKRMEARDAHDRYANLEISYLLERMERFKGLAVLATNRKKDLDEAFLRRLRYVIDFPLPGVEQRLHIWRQSIPDGVDVGDIDFDFLAHRFPMAGGHIRSVVFNACLQSAGAQHPPALGMETVVVALKRELDKINRPVSLDLFGAYGPMIQRMERETDGDTH